MGKLGELVSKGVRLIVTEAEDASPSEALAREREIPAETFEEPAPSRARSDVPADVADFAAVYQEAGIEAPAHGYGIDKAAEMLSSKRLQSMNREVKAAAVFAALEAAGAPIRDVVQDAVRRDRALDAFEAAKERELHETKSAADARVQQIQKEIEEFLRQKNAEIADLKQTAEAATRAFAELQVRKRREEERLHDVVSHFIEGAENPITAGPGPASPPPPKPDKA